MGATVGLTLGIASMAGATTFFVRAIGSDDNDGLTPETAFRSIGHGGRFLLNAGDRVVVGPGEYLEGNIEPRRGGSGGSPVAFVADTGGSLTGDPAGPVLVRPDANAPDQTTGFLVLGKQYVRIQGFTVVGAADAGIQVRPSAQTGGASVDVEITGNSLRNGRNGIDVLGSARVRIGDNEVSDNENGIVLRGEMDAGSDITVGGNRISGNKRGITASGLRGGRLEDNTIERAQRAITLEGGDGVLVGGNTLRDSFAAVFLDFAADVTVVDNSIEDCGHAVDGYAGASLSISRNRMNRLARGMLPTAAYGVVMVEDNEILDSRIIEGMSGPASFILRRNRISSYGRLRVSASAVAEVTDNELHGGAGGMSFAAARVLVQGNHHFGGRVISLQGDAVTLVGNDFQDVGRPISIRAAEAEVSNNDVEGHGAGLWYLWRHTTPGLARITANHVRSGKGILLKSTAATDVIVDGNEVAGAAGAAIEISTLGSAEIVGNQLSEPHGDGIHAQLDRDGSTALIQDNVVTGGSSAISLSGVRNALLQRNAVSGADGFGLLVRNGELVEIDSNQAAAIGGGAINVAGDAILLGDCDRDGSVTASEIERGVHRLFDDDLGADCSALGPQPHGSASVASLLGAVIDYAADLSHRRPSGQVSIHDNTVETSGGTGVIAFAAIRVTMARNTVRGSGATAISAAGGSSSELILEGNTVENSGNDCVLVSGGATARVTNVDVDTCSESGIRVRDTYAVTVEGTHVRRAVEPAILATRTSSWTSRGNGLSDSGGGFALIGAPSSDATSHALVALLEEERVERVAGVGLHFVRAARVTARGCQVASAALHAAAARECDVVELSGNTLSDAGRSGISIERAGQLGSREVILDGNLVTGFGQAAMDLHPTGTVLVTRNEIQAAAASTGAGVFIGYGLDSRGVAAVAGNRIRAGRSDAVHVENPLRVFVWDNAVFSSAGSGVFVKTGDATEVVNTLTYANGEHGIHLDHPGAARVFNNTSYRNAQQGLLVEGALSLALLDNIFDGNGSGSVAVRDGTSAINEGFNLTTGAYEGVTPAETDSFEDPRLVDPDGEDDALGGDGAEDDDFRLSSGSAAIDAGADTAEYFGISGSATQDGLGDTGPVDLGFHYGASPRVP